MLHRALIASGVVATVIMASLAFLVLDGPANPPEDALTASTSPGDEPALPDPEARGVVIGSLDWQLYSATADGEAAGGPFVGPYETGLSADGEWYAYRHCPDAETCMLVILPSASNLQINDFADYAVALDAGFVSGEWARDGATLAALDESGALYRVDPQTRTAEQVQACCVTAYAWSADDELLAGGHGKSNFDFWLASWGLKESIRLKLSSSVHRLFESPDGTKFAFAQDGADGLGLVTLDTVGRRITDYGVIHPAATAEDVPFAIAWSRDQRYIAVGPIAAPYSLYVLDTTSGEVVASYEFEEGYAGELVWSPVANRLAISTYSPDRLQHEVYVVDPTSTDAPRHLISGCRIVWSPDGGFLAAKAEPHALGAVAVNVNTGHQWKISPKPGFTPVAWGIDEASALDQVQVPGRSAAVLGK